MFEEVFHWIQEFVDATRPSLRFKDLSFDVDDTLLLLRKKLEKR